jgi:glycogen operon protein
VGNFPPGWAEWNGKYRDNVRRFWKGDGGTVSEFATRLAGSSDLYQQSGRAPYASVNFITCHDGFTLADLVSYNDKHNQANLEKNKDGASDNNSWNCGAEGPTDDPKILDLRERQRRNFIATLFFSQGVPMLLAGDEIGHTQQGNNNAYCQDNELTWLNWDLDESQRGFLEFVQTVSRIWQDQPVFQRRKFFQNRSIRGSDITDISWFNPSGEEMSNEDWNTHYARALGLRLAGDLIGDIDDHGQPIQGNTTLLLMNAAHEGMDFVLPETKPEHHWECVLDTSHLAGTAEQQPFVGGNAYKLVGRSVVLLVTRVAAETGQSVTAAQADRLRRDSRRTAPPPRLQATGAM